MAAFFPHGFVQGFQKTQLIEIVNVDFAQPLAVRLLFENTDAIPRHLRHLPGVLEKIERPLGSLIGIFPITLDTDDFDGEVFSVSCLDQVGPIATTRFCCVAQHGFGSPPIW